MKRWPIIRHIRFIILRWRAERWARQWASIGIGLGVLNESDVRYLLAVWDGEA